jgi:hypothetical protein
LQYNPDFGARRVQGNDMLRSTQCFFVILAFATLMAQPGFPQDKSQDKTKEPKIVMDLEKPAPSDDSSGGTKKPGGASGNARTPFRIGGIPGEFGEACKAFSSAEGPDRRLDTPVPLAELLGGPIAVVRVRRYGPGHEKPDRDEVRQRVAKILHARTDDIARGILWSEATFAGLVVTIEFSDHSKGVLEESGGHVCFSDHAGTVWYLRIPPDSTK